MVLVFILLDFKGLVGNADSASPWISPMAADGARISSLVNFQLN